MQEFTPGQSKTAVALIEVTPSGLGCEAEIFLGPDEATKVATSGRIPFTSTGVSQNVRLPVTMPDATGTYHVYIDVYAGGILVAAYQAIEDVVIVAPAFTFGTPVVTIESDKTLGWGYVAQVTCAITNNTGAALTRTIKCGWEKEDEPWKTGYRLWVGYPDYPREMAVTLSPGQSRTLVSPYYWYYHETDREHPNVPNFPDLSYRYYYWMEDDLGNMSVRVRR